MSLLDNLIAYYKLEETSGQRNDAHVNGYHLTDNNTVLSATGKIGTASSHVRASAEYLSRVDNADFSVGSDVDFTLTGWVYWSTFNSFHHPIGKWSDSDNQFEYVFETDVTGQLKWFVRNAADSGSATATWGSTLSTGTWYFLWGEHDSNTNLISLSVDDGTPVTAALSGGSRNGTAPFTIGGETAGSHPHNGRVDEVGFWKRILTSQEVTDLYNGGSGLQYPFEQRWGWWGPSF